jgi:HrpA-like RNA helicase
VNLWNYLGEQQKALSSNQFRRQCRVDFLNYLRVREWQDIYTQLRQVVKELGIPVNSEPAEYREIHIALLTGLLSHIGMKDADKQEYTGARNARFSIFPVPACSRSRRNGPWSPSWWKPAACGGALPPVSIRNGWSRWRSIC